MPRLLLAFALCAGCTGDLVELSTPPRGDLAQAPSTAGDLAQAPGPGAADLAQPPAASPHFSPDIQNDLDSLTCESSSCHGGTQAPVLVRAPATAADKTANYTNFKMFATSGAMSLVLTKNLAGSGVTHTGGSSFANTQDPIYQRWLAWINAGNPE